MIQQRIGGGYEWPQGWGNLLHWFFSSLTVFFLALILLGFLAGSGQLIIGSAFFGVLAWLIGRACRYVLAGR